MFRDQICSGIQWYVVCCMYETYVVCCILVAMVTCLASTAGGGSGDAGAGASKAAKAKATKAAMLDFLTEYAKSGAAKCRKCEEKILKVHNFSDVNREETSTRVVCNIKKELILDKPFICCAGLSTYWHIDVIPLYILLCIIFKTGNIIYSCVQCLSP